MSISTPDQEPDSHSTEKRDEATTMTPQEQLKQLIAKATALNGAKDYTAAASVYSDAAELQTEINGEMNVENADLLYSYGRCLFFVAQKTSTVLGGTAAQAQLSKDTEKKASRKRKTNGAPSVAKSANEVDRDLSHEATDNAATPADTISQAQQSAVTSLSTDTDDKPLFSFTGDGNFDDSDEEEEEEEEEDEEDDFETSFELLDLARVLYLRKLESLQEEELYDTSDKGKSLASTDMSAEIRQVKLRVADIYDLQSEISLEGEKFAAAVTDLKACLVLKEELEPPESSLLAECHYKLSLALEVAAQEQQRDADGNPVGDITINWEVRNEAVTQQEAAIQSCKLRVSKEKSSLGDLSDPKARVKAQSQIEDVEEMIAEMEDRLSDLRKPPVNVKTETENDLNREMMAGVLGQIMGATGKSKEQQRAELAEVMANATDLSSIVKKKSKRPNAMADDTASNASAGSSKRKIEELADQDSVHAGKKAKVEDAEDSGLQ